MRGYIVTGTLTIIRLYQGKGVWSMGEDPSVYFVQTWWQCDGQLYVVSNHNRF